MLKHKIIEILEKNPGQIVSGGQLAAKLDVSRTAVWKAINSLKAEGYSIATLRNNGYLLDKNNDILSEHSILKTLNTKTLGRHLEILKSVNSTNVYLKEKNPSGLSEGYVVIAEEQTAGRGRMDRRFSSPAGQGVYMSTILKPELPLEAIHFLTICAAVAVCKAIEKVCSIKTGIKWVNDIFAQENGGSWKKLCGILTEATISAEIQSVESIIIGIGINTGAVSAEVFSIATSVFELCGMRGIRNRLIAEVLNELEIAYMNFLTKDARDALLEEYSARLFIVNKNVNVLHGSKSFTAAVLGIDESGRLKVKKESGETVFLNSGEVSLALGD